MEIIIADICVNILLCILAFLTWSWFLGGLVGICAARVRERPEIIAALLTQQPKWLQVAITDVVLRLSLAETQAGKLKLIQNTSYIGSFLRMLISGIAASFAFITLAKSWINSSNFSEVIYNSFWIGIFILIILNTFRFAYKIIKEFNILQTQASQNHR